MTGVRHCEDEMGKKIQEEREERVKALLAACEGTCLNGSHFLIPDNSGHEVTISSAVFVALLGVVKDIRNGGTSCAQDMAQDMAETLGLLQQASSIGVVNPG